MPTHPELVALQPLLQEVTDFFASALRPGLALHLKWRRARPTRWSPTGSNSQMPQQPARTLSNSPITAGGCARTAA